MSVIVDLRRLLSNRFMYAYPWSHIRSSLTNSVESMLNSDLQRP